MLPNNTLSPTITKKRKIIRISKDSEAFADPEEKLALALLIEEHLGITNGEMFTSLRAEDKDQVGDRLRCLLREVAGGAVVPMMNHTLDSEDVRKLSSLKGTLVSKEDRSSPSHDLVKREEDDMNIDVNENMEAAIKDMDIWRKEQELEMGNAKKDEVHAATNKSCYNFDSEDLGKVYKLRPGEY